MSYRPMVYVHGAWSGNGLRFATREEAGREARDFGMRWAWVAWMERVDESSDPVNYAIVDGRLVAVVEEVVSV